MQTTLLGSFRHAFAGIGHVLRTQRNARIHLAVTIGVALLAIWMKIDLAEWAALALAAGLVWTAEVVNTALEAVVDLASPEHHELARVAKDVSAGAVLLSALAAIVVDALILVPALATRLSP